MTKALKNLYEWLKIFGVDPLKLLRSIRGAGPYWRDLQKLKYQSRSSHYIFPFGEYKPYLEDRYLQGGIASGHYFHQDLLVARRVFESSPEIHVDVASRMDGFVAHCASFREVQVIDIRPIRSVVANIKFIQANMMLPLSEDLKNYCDSLSCLHALEHFGLGRYGDPIDFEGYLLGFNNLYQMLKARGILYLSVPIGPKRIEFNAHRVFSIESIFELIENKFEIIHFSYVDDTGGLHQNATLATEDIANNFGLQYGCGIFELKKLAN